MLPSSLPLPHLWIFLLPLPAPDRISRFRFPSLSSKCFRFHKHLAASTSSFRFHIHVCNSCDWLSTRFHKLQMTLLSLLGSTTCWHVQQPQQSKKEAYHNHIVASGGFRGGDGGDASPPTGLKVTILAEKSASVSNKSAPFRDASPPTDLNVTSPAKNQSQFW